MPTQIDRKAVAAMNDNPCTLHVDPSQVEAALETYLSSKEPNRSYTRRWAKHHHALPLIVDMGGCVALRPDGTLIDFAWDAEANASTLSAPRECHVARAIGSRKYPWLDGLAPVRSSGSVTCTGCGGTGNPLPGNPLSIEGTVCICGNTGWLPE